MVETGKGGNPATALVLTNAMVADPLAEVAVPASVVIRDGRIETIGDGDGDGVREAASSGARVLDVAGRYVAPGLINMHTHFSLILPGARGREIASMGAHDLALYMADGARRSLLSGVTTVRCVSENDGADFALRRAIDAGRLDGPRIFTAGRGLVCTGGHGHENTSVLECDGADGFRRGVRAQIREGADLIKVMISGGIAGEHESIDTRQLTRDEIAATIETAHQWGRKVTAHAGPAPVISEAVGMGLDCVEHGYFLTDDVVTQMADAGCALVPTLGVSRCKEFFDECGVPDWMQKRALGAGDEHAESYRRALRAGVPVMLGSDLPPFWEIDGTNATAWEYGLMHEIGAASGFTARDALIAATVRPAEWLGAGDAIGRVAAGYEADLLVLDGDPLEDATAVRRQAAVIARGRIVKDDLT